MIRIRAPRALAAGVVLIISATIGHAAAQDPQAGATVVRSGNHIDYGRIVIETNGVSAYEVDQDGDHVVVRLDGSLVLGSPPKLPRNVIALNTNGAAIELTLSHGSRLHPMRLNGRVVLDVLDNPALAPKSPSNEALAQPRPPLSLASSPELGGRSALTPLPPEPRPLASQPSPDQPSPQQPSPQQPAEVQPPRPALVQVTPPLLDPAVLEETQQLTPGRDVLPENEGPVGLRARRVKLPKGIDGSAFLVPFDSTTAAAMFESGGSTYIAFDERRAVDVAALKDDPVFGASDVRLLPSGTLIRVPHPAAVAVALTQMPQGWRIAFLPVALKRQPIAMSQSDGRLNLAAEAPGNVISMADPDTGATLLVGTQHRPGQGVATSRMATEFILRPTLQGVVVEPLSDKITLRQVPTGFSLAGGPTGLLLSPPSSTTDAMMEATHLTHRVDFSTLPADALLRRSIKEFNAAAAAAPLARGRKHHEVAETLIALGFGAEAESLLHMAAEQDPREAASPDTAALAAIAALLAGRTAEADALTDPRLDGTDEIALWRGVRQAMLDEGSPAAAAVFASTALLVFQYPAPVREHILPLVVETMIQGGEVTAAAQLLNHRKDDPKLGYARALMRQAEGNNAEALSMLDALANGHDQFDRVRAAVRAVELRLETGEFDKTKAADALDKLLYTWRADARELALRERVAELRGQAGAWRVALATLRQAETDFPEQAKAVHEHLKNAFTTMMRDQGTQQIPPLEFVAMVDENTDLMPEIEDKEAIEQALSERLLALDLPSRAKQTLEKLLRSATSTVTKARFGLSLAKLDARERNDSAARAVLDASEGPDLPADLAEQRMILHAGAVARLGDPTAAAATLAAVHTAQAAEARAQILENAADWAGASQAWRDDVALALPESGPLDDAQARTVLRLATATARAGDVSGLATLHAKYADRLAAGPASDMFRLLTADPVRTSGDIKRSNNEMSLAASVPADLTALKAAAGAH